MKTSALKTLAALALTTAGCVSFAQQQPTDANAPGNAYGPSAAQNTTATGAPSPGLYRESTAPTPRPNYAEGTSRACSGLSDRQTERACRQGFPTDFSGTAADSNWVGGGHTDDQAD